MRLWWFPVLLVSGLAGCADCYTGLHSGKAVLRAEAVQG